MFLIFCSTHDFANAAINSISLPSSVCVVLTCVQSENCQLLKGQQRAQRRRADKKVSVCRCSAADRGAAVTQSDHKVEAEV